MPINETDTSSLFRQSHGPRSLLRFWEVGLMMLLTALALAGCETALVGTDTHVPEKPRVQKLASFSFESGAGQPSTDSKPSGIQLDAQVVNGRFSQVSVSCYGPGALNPCPTGTVGEHTVLATLKNTSSNTVMVTGINLTNFSNCGYLSLWSTVPVTLVPDALFSVMIQVNVYDASNRFGVWFDVEGEVL